MRGFSAIASRTIPPLERRDRNWLGHAARLAGAIGDRQQHVEGRRNRNSRERMDDRPARAAAAVAEGPAEGRDRPASRGL